MTVFFNWNQINDSQIKKPLDNYKVVKINIM